MKLEQALTYVTHHSESIIQWLLFAILAISGLLIARSMFSKKAAGGDNSELSDALKKIMEQTAKLEAISLDKAAPGTVAAVDGQVQALKTDLANREAEIAKLKAAGTADPKAAEEAKALASRIQELEAKLSEYEILEDDIADLSLYKEENTRLRSEIEKIKGGGAASPAPAAAEAAKPAGGEPGDSNDIVAEFAQAVSADPEIGPPPATIEVQDTGDPMADFESAVKAEKKVTGAPVAEAAPAAAAPTPTPTPAPAPKPAPAPVAQAAPEAAPAAPAASGEAEDLFAEFSTGTEGGEGGGGLDTDKMMAEMAALVSMEPSSGSALEEGIDTDKMALEATSLTKS